MTDPLPTPSTPPGSPLPLDPALADAPAALTTHDLTTGWRDLLQQALDDAGEAFAGDITTVAAYASARTAHLSRLTGDPDFATAVAAERDSIALFVSTLATGNADLLDRRILSVIQGGLTIGARAAVAALAAA